VEVHWKQWQVCDVELMWCRVEMRMRSEMLYVRANIIRSRAVRECIQQPQYYEDEL
jgi:hypothetical protein